MQTATTTVPADELAIDSVTGVEVSLPIAGAGGRGLAFVIDWHIRVLLAIAWWRRRYVLRIR